jgi:DDE superfamily endonuclease
MNTHGGRRIACSDETMTLMLKQCDAAAADPEQQHEDSYAAIAATHGFSSSKWLRQKHRAYDRGAPVLARPRGGARVVAVTEEVDAMLNLHVLLNTGTTQKEVREVMAMGGGLQLSTSSISRSLIRSGLSKKQKTTVQRAKFTADNAVWLSEYLGAIAWRPAATLHYFDETMVASRDPQGRQQHWGPRGQPVFVIEPTSEAYKFSCAALTSLRAGSPPMAVRVYPDTTLGGDVAEFFRDMLLHTAILQPGDTVIMDNCRTHNGGMGMLIRALLREYGVDLVYLPPYSPELNPIELAFAHFKHLLREKLPVRHSRLETRAAIDMAFGMISPDDVAAYYRHCGIQL